MKANNAPEKLYFGEGDKGILDIYSNRESNNEIEYTRTDALIEKAVKYINYYNQNMVKKYGAKALLGCSEFTINVNEFRKYIKGE